MATYDRNTEGLELVHKFADQVKGRTFLLTGPSPGGIGAETVTSLATESPALLILVGRSPEKAQTVIDAIKKANPGVKTKFVQANFASLKSVRKAAQAILDDPEITKIDVVINNAAVMATPFELTEDKLELQFQSNHLGHFVLTNKIMPKIIAAGPGARLVNLSSLAHKLTGVRFEDPNFAQPGSYGEFTSYGQSKSANLLYTVGLNKRLSSRGIRAFAVHPGSIQTNIHAHTRQMDGARLASLMDAAIQKTTGMTTAEFRAAEPYKTLQQGCGTTLRAALDPDLVKEEGVYLQNTNLTTDPNEVKDWATDPELAEKLWKLSEELVGEKFDI
ncbi:NAD(P)-binding protein [Daldinia decipiens]|uniref:NAD(P)-binding protein n=1 Tax=Daldinia decipiens TaxID=326647 RepID=UPI0020C223EE|nr:NAD(P)-binding protein [Daldinia decipiens]KAI1657897.1 NAD(P)-binding protein [Daldinia decipiens]